MVSVPELTGARPQQWRDAADDAVAAAQRDLTSALDYAHRQGFQVYDSGRVNDAPKEGGGEGKATELSPAQGVVTDALTRASRADTNAARSLRTIEGMTSLGDAKLAQAALQPNSPLAIALRLTGGLDGLHPVNVPPNVLSAVNLASAETGISRKLLLAILWQEQQWYQNHNPSLRGPLTEFGRFFDWSLSLGPKPDKSLGITHMKTDTARTVVEKYREKFQLEDGRYLADLSDQELAALIEHQPELDVRLSAYHLAALREDEHGAGTDKQLFTLYAADTPDVREKNEQYGDESEHRGGEPRRPAGAGGARR